MWLRDRDDEMPFREMVRLCLRWTLAALPSMLVFAFASWVIVYILLGGLIVGTLTAVAGVMNAR